MNRRLVLAGEVDREALADLVDDLQAVPAGGANVDLDLVDADVEDAVMVARLAEALRDHGRRFERLTVLHAPQVLAHTLYRIGALEGGNLRLVEPRSEIGSAG